MTQQYQRLAIRHVRLLGIIAGLAVVSSILLSGVGDVLSIGANVTTTAAANTTSTGAAAHPRTHSPPASPRPPTPLRARTRNREAHPASGTSSGPGTPGVPGPD